MKKNIEIVEAIRKDDIEAMSRAIQLLCAGNIELSLEVLESRKERFSHVPEYHFLLAKCLSQLGRPEEALDNLRAIIARKPNHAKARQMADELTITIEKEKLVRDPNKEAKINHGLRLVEGALQSIQSGQIDQAHTHIVSAKDLDIPLMNLHFVEAIYYLQTGHVNDALQSLMRETNLFPDNQPAQTVLHELNNQLPG